MYIIKHHLPRVALLGLAPFWLAGCAHPAASLSTQVHHGQGSDPAAAPLTLSVDLSDGSRLVGTPAIKSLAVQTPYAKLEIALDQVRRVTMAQDRESAAIEMVNGDRINGALVLKSIEIQTAFGKVKVGAEQIARIGVLAGGSGRLVLWNRLGSLPDVARSEAGVNGVVEGAVGFAPVGTQPGVFLQDGQSLVKFDRPFGDEFPETGCIEFWWTPAHDEDSSTGSHMAERTVFVLSTVQTRPGGRHQPTIEILVKYRAWWAPAHFNRTYVCFQVYDEALGCVIGTDETFDLNYRAGQPMHLALSWNRAWDRKGIKFFKDGVEVPFAYADGGDIRPAIDLIRRRLTNLPYDLALLRDPRRSDGAGAQFDEGMRIANLKIWNYAKTNFADSLAGR